MNMLLKVLVIMGILLVILIGVAYLLPSRWSVERSIVINAPSTAIHPEVENLKKWEEWTPWATKGDPSVVQTYEGPEAGKGAIMRWHGEKMGTGMMMITESDPTKGITFEMQLDSAGNMGDGSIRYQPEGNGTRVTWSSNGKLGNSPVSRYFGLMIDSLVGANYDKGLANLKQKVEHPPHG